MRFNKNKILVSCRRAKTDGRAVIAGIAIVLLAGILSRVLSGSPLYMLRLTGLWHKVPRSWVFVLIWTFWYALLGFIFGFVLGSRQTGKEVHKYKGSLWFVIMLVFNFIWYPLFFKAGTVFLALVDSALILFFCVLAALEYYKVYKIFGIGLICHAIWLVWCLVMNFSAFLSI